MRRWFPALLASWISPAVAEEPPYFHLYQSRVDALAARVARQVLRIEVTRSASGAPGQRLRYDGAGVHVGGGRVLTCAFYLDGASTIRVRLPDGGQATARPVRRSLPLGLALLDVPAARSLPVPEIGPDEGPPRGAAIYLLANPTTADARLSVGWVLDRPPDSFYGKTTFVARNGHPLWDEWGRLAGIAALPSRTAAALFIPAWAVRKFLEPAPSAPPSTR